MSTVDQFESVFRAAAKTNYVHEKHPLAKVLLVTDMEKAEATLYLQTVRKFLEGILPETQTDWMLVSKDGFENVKDLLDKVEEHQPDLVISYRNLRSDAWRWPYSLGEHLDVLTQVTTTPVLVLPHPDREDATGFLDRPLQTVMAVSGHLCGEGTLVGYSSAFTPSGGKLILSHVEDELTLDRYLDAIEKIPELDSEVARETILSRLLNDAKDFSESAREALRETDLDITVECHAKVGRRLEDYRKLIEDEHVDLLVMHAKEDDQMAMHGMAHPLAVELRTVPLLLL